MVHAQDADGVMTFKTGCLHSHSNSCVSVIQANGAIFGLDTLDRFNAYILAHPNHAKLVSLNSLGGNANLAMILGEDFRKQGFNTIVETGHICESACVYMFLGGNQRTLDPNTYLAVHTGFQIHIDGNTDKYDDVRARFAIGQLLTYIRVMNINPHFINLVFNSLDHKILFRIPMDCAAYLNLENTTPSDKTVDPCQYLNYPLQTPTQYVSPKVRAFIKQQTEDYKKNAKTHLLQKSKKT